MYSTIEEVHQFLQARKGLGVRLGLERMKKMLDLMDHPEKKLKIVHIAGTNGKGSTITFLKQVLLSNDYNVGTFMSPSLRGFNDHIHINNIPLSDQSLIEVLNELRPAIQQLDQANDPPTEYEILVMIALVYFIHKVDIALIETNMGGSEDSSNIVSPILTMITNIGLDHIGMLGETYKEIATHKAGIIKPKTPVILGEITGEALDVIKKQADILHAPLYCYNKDFHVSDHRINHNRKESFVFHTNNQQLPVTLLMRGRHQITNAALSCMALHKLEELGFNLRNKEELGKAFIPGRFEQVHSLPTVIIDAAHNKEGIAAFIETVDRYFPLATKHLLFAAYKDKPLKEMIKQLEGKFEQVTFTTFSHPRASEANELSSFYNQENKRIDTNWRQVILEYLKKSDDDNCVLFITGSLHFIGLAREYFDNSY